MRAAAKAEYDATNAFQQHRSDWIRDHSFKGIIEEVVMDLMVGIAKDTYREGKNAKKSAERLSGLVFPNPRGMQYDAYRSLVEVWKAQERAERNRIKRGLAAGAKAREEIPLDEAALIEEKKRKRRERQGASVRRADFGDAARGRGFEGVLRMGAQAEPRRETDDEA